MSAEEPSPDEHAVTVISDAIIEANRIQNQTSSNDTTDNIPDDQEVHEIADAIIQATEILNQNASVDVTNLNVTDNSLNCNNCSMRCIPAHKSPLRDTAWYWYLIIGLLLCLVAMGAGLGTWIFLDERKTRKVKKKRAERRASLAGPTDR
ncbi:uncharacterized protein LY89DRAFT_667790 [Mollisia scopiformis]|uniref:Uncharacterized protein n=1 Tax=Mollisia scopiformis TaxID=149040 RepID=A0A194XG24_MOLSC|nr:uncharacterized protein LY89DRAFT_667790 [Mollisia scopiformis]KUJ18722.1 hypothetical protein LY89DRAFT_667790 [Mollisia scopiformis]